LPFYFTRASSLFCPREFVIGHSATTPQHAIPIRLAAFISFRTPRSAFRIRMIPREILKKIRQIAIGTNRPVSETLVHFGAGERARRGRSQRRPRRWLPVARGQTDSLARRRTGLRAGEPPGTRAGCAPRD